MDGVEARSNQLYAQGPGMSLCESMYGPHVLVCVRVRGVFHKKKALKYDPHSAEKPVRKTCQDPVLAILKERITTSACCISESAVWGYT